VTTLVGVACSSEEVSEAPVQACAACQQARERLKRLQRMLVEEIHNLEGSVELESEDMP
jgi:hypothetical protein